MSFLDPPCSLEKPLIRFPSAYIAVCRSGRTIPVGGTADRKFNHGREYRIVKVFYRPAELQELLRALGFRATIREATNFFPIWRGIRLNLIGEKRRCLPSYAGHRSSRD